MAQEETHASGTHFFRCGIWDPSTLRTLNVNDGSNTLLTLAIPDRKWQEGGGSLLNRHQFTSEVEFLHVRREKKKTSVFPGYP